MKIISLIIVSITGLILAYAAGDFPGWSDPQSPASTHLSSHYLEHSLEETAVPNVVTSILADYRGFDTMFETGVVFIAGLAVISLLRRVRKKEDEESPVESPTAQQGGSLIIRSACRILIPFMQLFALYVVAHGHHSPGGGFQGGVILGASLVLLALGYDLKTALRRMKEKTTLFLACAGFLIYAGIGALSMALGGTFLDYSAWSKILPATDEVMARSHGMLGVEIGVAFTVMAIIFSIYVDLSSHGQLDEGL